MTLQQMFDRVPVAEEVDRVPSVLQLTAEAVPVAVDTSTDGVSVTVFSNGFVIYQRGQWATVFQLHNCRDYTYTTVEEKLEVPFSEFKDKPWQIRLMLEGEDRLVHNLRNRAEGRALSIDAFETAKELAQLSDDGAGDALRILVQRDLDAEERETLRRNMAKLTDKQRQVMILCIVQGKTRMEAAEEIGTTHQAVTDNLKRAIRKLRKLYGLDKKNI